MFTYQKISLALPSFLTPESKTLQKYFFLKTFFPNFTTKHTLLFICYNFILMSDALKIKPTTVKH